MATVYSMTGYARGEGKVADRRVTIEVKTVNHRYLDLKLHLPRELSSFEPALSELCRGLVARGRVDVFIGIGLGGGAAAVVLNRPLAEGMIAALRELKETFELKGEPDLALLAGREGVILIDASGPLGETAWPEFSALAAEVFHALRDMRAKEGAALARDLQERIGVIAANFESAAAHTGEVVEAYREKLERRIRELGGDAAGLPADRLAQEVVMFADRSDVTEELVRARSHLSQFRAALAADGPKGRKLDFLVQEISREINTLSNKCQSALISGLAVDIKTELEKVREQVQNLE
jgi:uncharacterized protein (TIGR00255 family)